MGMAMVRWQRQQGEYGGGSLVVPAMAFFPVWEKIDFLDLWATFAL